MVLRERPSGSFRSKPALNDLHRQSAPRRRCRRRPQNCARSIGQLAQGIRRQCIDAVAAVRKRTTAIRHRARALSRLSQSHSPRRLPTPFSLVGLIAHKCPLACRPAFNHREPDRVADGDPRCRYVPYPHGRKLSESSARTSRDFAPILVHDRSRPSPPRSRPFGIVGTELRVRALETVLTEKGYVNPAALDLLIETYETKVGPRNGARVVARAWSDPAIAPACSRTPREHYRNSAMPAVKANTSWPSKIPPRSTTWSCARCAHTYPWPVLGSCPGLVQVRALSLQGGEGSAWRARRFRLPNCPRAPGSASGIPPPKFAISCCRCALRAAGGWSEERLADLVTRDSMIGAGLPKQPHEAA